MRRLLALLLAAVISVVAPACGESASAQEIVAGAADATNEAGTSKLTINIKTKVGDQEVNVATEGLIDYANERGRLTMDLAALGLPGASGTMEMLLMGKVIFMKLPPQGLPAELQAKPWVRLDIEKLAQREGFNLGSLDQLRNSNPTNTLEYLRGAADDVTEVGSEKIRGEDTTHYKATLDLTKAGEAEPKAKEAIDEAIKQLGTSTIPVEVWIDDEGRLRRMRYDMDLSKSPQAKESGQQLGNLHLDMELYDFGTKVDVSEPPADQFTEFETLLGGE
jgi:hypothetical protein